jgi:predicted Zn-dependent peptidase
VAHHALDGTGVFLAYACCPPKHAQRVEQALSEVLDGAADELSDNEVERARNKIATDLTLGQERPSGRMLSLGGQWLYTGQYRSMDEELQRVMAVTPQTLRELCERFAMSPRAVVRMTPDR